MVIAARVGGRGIIPDEAYDLLASGPGGLCRLPLLQESVLRSHFPLKTAAVAPEADAGECGIGEDIGQQVVIGRPVLEALWRVADGLVADAARGHPRRHHLLIDIGLRLLDARVTGDHEIRRRAAAFELDEERRAVDADAIGKHDGSRLGDADIVDVTGPRGRRGAIAGQHGSRSGLAQPFCAPGSLPLTSLP
ncbi:hypothetical protein MBESOW_P4216 [Sphingobium xenophagum]|uniref:Uncharacterized protein n=1 Tax=Sphingobium xenophagum TaxID=121428 RepID=A0A401J8U0_SPHXE|nr:hypothetical protein MBESOW_P4216 [Sphingobium xenophagum]